MFKYTQSIYETYSDKYITEDYKTLTEQERLRFNPEEYHTFIEKLYEHKNDKSTEDFNQNIYSFPIRMSSLYDQFKEIMETKEDMENH